MFENNSGNVQGAGQLHDSIPGLLLMNFHHRMAVMIVFSTLGYRVAVDISSGLSLCSTVKK